MESVTGHLPTLAREPSREAGHGVLVSAGDRVGRRLEDLADLGERHFFPDLEDHDFGLLGRQCAKGNPHGAVLFFSLELVDTAERDKVGKVAGRLAALLTAGDDEGLVAHHPQQVGPRAVDWIEQLRLAGQADQGSLNRVFRVVLVASQRYGKSNEPIGRQVEQRTERVDSACRESVGAFLDTFGK
jgi:hypothetical protein